MSDATWTFMMIAFLLIIIANLIMFYQKGVFGDDTADEGRPTLNEQLLERAREWNIQKAINETLATAERFDK